MIAPPIPASRSLRKRPARRRRRFLTRSRRTRDCHLRIRTPAVILNTSVKAIRYLPARTVPSAWSASGMDRARILMLLLAAGIAAAASGSSMIAHLNDEPADPVAATAGVSPDLCLSAGAVTYRLSPTAAAPDYRVRIDAAHPDLRIELVDGVENADFALVDDGG